MIRFFLFSAGFCLLVCRSKPIPLARQPVAGEIRDEWGMVFVPIPAGSFYPDAKAGSSSSPAVALKAFYLGGYEVTQAEWSRIMNENPSAYQAPNHPVENVSWLEVQVFIEKLNAVGNGWRYRLPSEAEWEYACRAGAKTAYSFGDDPLLSGDYAWTRRNAGKRHHPVGLKRPNAWGLYDMHGNVWEWCAGEFEHPEGSDPRGRGTPRGYRGGSFHYHPVYARSDYRLGFSERYRSIFTGFRLVAEPRDSGD